MRNRIFLLAVLLIAGCTWHTPMTPPLPVALPDRYAEQPDDLRPAAPAAQWWRTFKDPQLDRLMDTLFAQNLELVQLSARLEQVQATTAIRHSARWPTLTGTADASRSQQPLAGGDFTGDSRRLSLAAAFELDLWGRLAALEKASDFERKASQQDLMTLYLSLSARLGDLYFLAVEQREQLALTDQLIASFADTENRVEQRYRLGLVPAIDLYQSRQSLAGARAARQLYEARLAEAEHAINVLLGNYPGRASARIPDQLPLAPDLFAVGNPNDLIRHRPDLQAALHRVAAADQGVAAAIADRFPSLRLSGDYGDLHQDLTGGLVSGPFWSLLGSLTQPIVDGGRRSAEVDRNQAVLKEAVAVYQQQVLTAFQDVEDALANNLATTQRIDHLVDTAEATAATLRLATDRYLAGVDDYLPVLTAQRADFDSQSRLVAARRQLLTDRISLARALGGSWMRDVMVARQQMEKDSEP